MYSTLEENNVGGRAVLELGDLMIEGGNLRLTFQIPNKVGGAH
jgi:hypothetical protein